MYSQSDISSVYDFLRSTNEGNLRKMFVGGKMQEVHFGVFLKIGKLCTEADFIDAFMNESIPKMKMSMKEREVKETLWPICKGRLEELGLITQSAAKAA